MRKIMVTGGSGYVGRHLIRELLDRYEDVQVYSMSRSEGMIAQLLIECQSDRLKVVMGDVRDEEAVRWHMRGVDTAVHLAALKRVDLCEVECHETVETNVRGTMNLLEAFRGKTFVLMSTDKAVEPANCYGASKMISEKLVMERAKKRNGARYMIVRSGNVIGSTGSVTDIWRHQIRERNEITITHPDMMRFYTSVEGVVRLYIAVLEKGESGKIYFTPQGEAVVIGEMAQRVMKLYGNENTKIKYIGLRPGERMIEKMRSLSEENTVAGFEEMVSVSKRMVPVFPAAGLKRAPSIYEYGPWAGNNPNAADLLREA
jgi:UDP-N-acetylglucosamine 4,6-dehydratase